MSNTHQEANEGEIMKSCGLQSYLAAAFGAFLLGLGDLMRHDTQSVVRCIPSALRLDPTIAVSMLLGLAFIIIVGMGLCWVYGPGTRADAFSRGLSVFAVLALAASPGPPNSMINDEITTRPRSEHRNPSGSKLGMLGIAYAQHQPGQGGQNKDASSSSGLVIVKLNLSVSDATTTPSSKKITLRDSNTKKVIAFQEITRPDQFTIQQSTGDYLLDIEIPGSRRIRAELKIEDKTDVYILKVPASGIPLFIQRLYGPESVPLEKPENHEKFKIMGVAFHRSRNYEEAVKCYEKALSEKPNDVEIYNYMGYSLFRLKKCDQALASLKKAIEIDPSHFLARLNFAKVSCTMNNNGLAEEVLLGEIPPLPPLSKDQLLVVTRDEEFGGICKSLYEQIAREVK